MNLVSASVSHLNTTSSWVLSKRDFTLLKACGVTVRAYASGALGRLGVDRFVDFLQSLNKVILERSWDEDVIRSGTDLTGVDNLSP
jgi:hypothetical protein